MLHKTLCSVQRHPAEIQEEGGEGREEVWRKREKNASGMKEMVKRVRPPTSIEMDQSNLITPRN